MFQAYCASGAGFDSRLCSFDGSGLVMRHTFDGTGLIFCVRVYALGFGFIKLK